MAFELTIESRPGFLHARVRGENSADTIRGYMAGIRAACEENRCANVLVEEHLTGPGLQAFDIFELISGNSASAARSFGRIALVDVNPEHDLRMMNFAETVAVNRGVNFRAFATVAEAERWLTGAAPPD